MMSSPLESRRVSLRRAFAAVLKRELSLRFRRRQDLASPMLFFALTVTLFPLGLGPDPAMLGALAPGLLWVAALLAVLLSLDGLFRADYDDGTLEQLLLSAQPVALLVLAKVIAHWVVTGLVLSLFAPLFGAMLALPAQHWWALAATLALGSATLSLIGAIGAALTVGLKRGGVLLSLLVLPLYTPVLIFGAGAAQLALEGVAIGPQLALLGAMLAAALGLAPWATAAALRLSVAG
ncbi:heme exporter protein CcmB [Halotalea alkalilenta]|uniref:Heme exporter protein B n=2 Tax=Halotalea alkalilenta TaxID=376489 RepID=A0A172YD80_9GAMM|nr:heme exporter protein CcmB [Halotalea alkalilenta]